MSTAYERLRAALTAHGSLIKETGGQRFSAQCPGHDDHDPSLSVTGIEGAALVYCHGGCDTGTVLAALNLTPADLYDTPKGAQYVYPDGRTVHRTPGKKFRQSGNTKGRALYRADRITEAEHVYVVEGEKDVLAAESVGVVAVCSAMGAGKADRFDWTPLAGKTVTVVADNDEPGLKHAAQVAALVAAAGAAATTVKTAAVGKDLADHIAAGKTADELVDADLDEIHLPPEPPAEPGQSSRRLVVTRGSEVKAKRLIWWEPGLVLQYAINLLAAREGKGKSTVASSWAARETRNGGTVLWIGTEESREHAIVPRLIAAGADMDLVIFVDVQTDLGTGALMFPLDLARIETTIREHGVTMIFLDPAKAVVPPGFSGNDDIAVRQYLEPLAALADRCKATIVGLAHFGKRTGVDSGQLMLGSVAWSQVARCVLSIGEDPDAGTRVLTNTKANYVGTDRSVEFRIVSTTIDTDDGPTDIGSVEWLGDTTADARDFLGCHDDQDDAGERTAAEHWLHDYLTANGPTPSKVVKSEAAKERIAERTLQRAKKKIGIVDSSSGFPRISTWSLPAQFTGGATGSYDPPVMQERGATGATGDDLRKQDGATDVATGENHSRATPCTTGATGDQTELISEPSTPTPLDARRQELDNRRTVTFKGNHVPRCHICGNAVLGDQGDAHLSCLSKEQEKTA